jgi:hypothetical protein
MGKRSLQRRGYSGRDAKRNAPLYLATFTTMKHDEVLVIVTKQGAELFRTPISVFLNREEARIRLRSIAKARNIRIPEKATINFAGINAPAE